MRNVNQLDVRWTQSISKLTATKMEKKPYTKHLYGPTTLIKHLLQMIPK